ncbi:hypothetical protein ACFXKX_09725 [Streptomyces scopuliridis]
MPGPAAFPVPVPYPGDSDTDTDITNGTDINRDTDTLWGTRP